MSDIVERLRRDKWHVSGVDCETAAQEIERLRDQLHLAEVVRASQVEGLTQGAAGWRERANQLEAEVAGLREELEAARQVMRSVRVFVTSGEKIKHPEGTEWFDSAVTAIDAALAARKGTT